MLKKGDTFTGKAKVLGNDTMTEYSPIKDANGNIIGMWFVGIDSSVISQSTFKILSFSAIILLLLML